MTSLACHSSVVTNLGDRRIAPDEAFRVLNDACGRDANVVLEPTIRRYDCDAEPTTTYRIHVWIGHGQHQRYHFCQEGVDLSLLLAVALADFRAWKEQHS